MTVENDLRTIRRALKFVSHDTYLKHALEAEAALERLEQFVKDNADTTGDATRALHRTGTAP